MSATEDAEGAQANALALLWDGQPAPRRGPRPTLTLAAIATAGIELADRAGLVALTMQNVAQELGVTKMALYRYVPGKVELVALMTDAALGPPPELSGGWRARIEEWARRLFDGFLAHRWSLETTIGPRGIGPNELGWMEQAVAALAGTGLTGPEKLDVAATVSGHVRAIAMQAAAVEGSAAERILAATIRSVLRERAERFPALAAAFGASAGQDAALGFGLARILDGVELLISSR